MKPIRFMVALMAIVISTAAFNSANAQNIRHSNGNRTENRQQMHKGDNHGGHDAHHGNNHYQTPTHHAQGPQHHDAHHNGHNDRYAYHNHYDHYNHYAHDHYYYDRCHGYVAYHARPSHIHHMCAGYVPVVGHVVDALPPHHVICEVDGFRFYRALGHIFRPIVIGGIIHFIVE